MSGFDVLVIGDCNPDLIIVGGDVEPAFGQVEQLVDEGRMVIGGSGSITACGAARLGLRTAFVGAVGDDALGRFMLDALRDRGVDVSGCTVREGRPSGVSVILVRDGGTDRAILTASGATGTLTALDIPPDLIDASRHVHVASYFLHRSLRSEFPSLLRGARAAGCTVSIDPNWDPAGGWDAELVDAMSECDVFVPNEAEATRIAGVDDVTEAALALSRLAPVVAVKTGPAGALLAVSGATSVVPAPRVDVVDTIGAGDSFDAGFVAGFLAGWDPERAVALGCACGALSTRDLGGTAAQPTMAEAIAAAGVAR